MGFDIVFNNEICVALFRESILPLQGMLYYSHIPTALLAVFVSFFVFIKSGKSLSGRLLLSISAVFSLWSLGDLVTWTSYDTRMTMFFWSLLGILYMLIFALSLYFTYVFFDKDDISVFKKVVVFFPIFPAVVLTPTVYNLVGFDGMNCEASEGPWFTSYYHLYGAFIILWIFLVAVSRYRRASSGVEKNQTVLFAFGIEFFLGAFFLAGYISSLIDNFNLLIYGLFGMPIFMGFLAYLIVTFRAFDVKLLQAQALVSAMAILIGSQFFFVHNPINLVLTAVTLALVAVFGWWLVRSVRREDEQRDKLEEAYLRLNQDKVSLERMNKELQTLDQAKSEFINIASHQLRTPVTVIRGVVSLLRDGSMDAFSPEKKKQFYESAWTKCEKLEDIIDDVLNATSLINRKYSAMDKDVEPIDLKAFLERMIADFETETRERELSLVLARYDESLPPLYAQKQYLEEVFSNLLTNAIKYTPSPKKTTDIRGTRDDREARVEIQAVKDGDCAVITVRDNGIGIPVEAMPKLFQKFSRAENATNMYTDGSGLGLFIVKEIVEGHGGSVWVESEIDKGSTFFVKLPLHREEKVDVKRHIIENVTVE